MLELFELKELLAHVVNLPHVEPAVLVRVEARVLRVGHQGLDHEAGTSRAVRSPVQKFLILSSSLQGTYPMLNWSASHLKYLVASVVLIFRSMARHLSHVSQLFSNTIHRS